MKIENSTKWETADLRKLFRRCVSEVDKIEKPSWRFKNRCERFTLKFENRSTNWRKNRIGGRAIVNGFWILITIGTDIDFKDIEKKKRLAQLIIHEYYHTLGYKSQDRKNYKHDWTEKFEIGFVADYEIRKAQPKPKKTRNLQSERYQKALTYVRSYETKLKRTKTLLKKWKRKQRYYERTFAKRAE